MKRRQAPPPRGGLIDLFLVGFVVIAAATRTPLGALGTWGFALATGSEAERPSLIATFVTSPIPEVIARLEAVTGPISSAELADGAFPEPFRTAAQLSLSASVPKASQPLLAAIVAEDPGPIDLLDHLHGRLHSGDPEATLEIYAIGEELRARAIQRARAAGEDDPARYEVHRRYLPAAAAKQADEVVNTTLGVSRVLSLAWPVAEPHRISSSYGWRHHPTLGRKKLHNGVDLAVPIGTPILAAQSGTVTVAKEDNLNGKYVIIDHGYGVRSSYCHLDELGVEADEEVERAAQIALSGNSGRSTGPHLHFTLRVGKETVDPERFRPPEEPES